MKKFKIWKKIKKSKYKSIKHLLNDLINKGYILSPWINNIFNYQKNNFSIDNQSYFLYRVKVSELGFHKATKQKIK